MARKPAERWPRVGLGQGGRTERKHLLESCGLGHRVREGRAMPPDFTTAGSKGREQVAFHSCSCVHEFRAVFEIACLTYKICKMVGAT